MRNNIVFFFVLLFFFFSVFFLELSRGHNNRRTEVNVGAVTGVGTTYSAVAMLCVNSSQVHTIKSIIKLFGWREVVPVYIDNTFGEGIMPRLTDALQEINVRIPYRSVIALNATDDEISVELLNMMTMPTRVFIVHMYSSLAPRVFIKAMEIGLMRPGYVWILTNGVTDDLSSIDEIGIEAMEGVLGVKIYIHKSNELEKFRSRWRKRFPRKDLNVYGLWAYDATTALAVAIEEAGTNNLTFSNAYRGRKVSELEALGLSQFGPKLLQSRVQFKGLAGDFRFVSGQLEPSVLEIVNVVGTGMKRGSFAFLKPLSWRLWLASFVYFLLTGITLWVVEHRVNPDFRGPVTYQGERVFSFWARIMVITWNFLVLVLTQSYTASLASLLTPLQLHPTITSMSSLLERGETVGYQRTSFIPGKLKETSFSLSSLVPSDTTEECDELLRKGPEKGDVSAAFWEISYLRLFLGQYDCSR